jgi:hypothetical protein
MSAAGLVASLDRIGQVQAHLSGTVCVLMAIVGIGAALVPGVWHVVRPITAMAHEGAHATVGSALGHKIAKMEFTFNGDGATGVVPASNGSLVLFPSAFVGYLGPSAFGIGAAELIRVGHIVAVLWIGLVGLIAILYLARKSVGVVLVIAAFVALLLVLGAGSVEAQVLTTYAVVWFLLASGVRLVLNHGKEAGDAGILKGMTGLPRGFWPPIWLAGSVAALIFGATLLL